MKKINKILVVGGLHGNEPTGIKITSYLMKNKIKNISTILANSQAVKENIRFLETDLNRSFSTQVPVSYEEHLADKIQKKVVNYDLILDFHNSVANNNNCSIVTEFPNELLLSVSKY